MPGVIATLPRLQFSRPDGAALNGGTLTTFLSGSTTKTPTWQDQALTIYNANPLVLDSRGGCTVWLDSGLVYKIVLADRFGVPQWTQDNIIGGGVDSSFNIAAASLAAAVVQATASANTAMEASDYLNTYIDQVALNVTFPLDHGLIADPVIYSTFDLGTI